MGRPRPHGPSYAAVSDRLTGKAFLGGRSWRGTETQLCPAEVGKDLKPRGENRGEAEKETFKVVVDVQANRCHAGEEGFAMYLFVPSRSIIKKVSRELKHHTLFYESV